MNLRRYVGLHRLTAYTAILALLLPLFAALPASAQSQAPMQVGVVEFRNDSGVQGEMLARYATDAVVIEMSKSARFDVITRAQIEAQMKELGLGRPLSGVELRRLGDSLAAEAMIEGAIKAVEIRGSGPNHRAAVTIAVRMVDQASGEVINGAIQTGYSTVRVGDVCDDDKLIAEAINNAAFQAVKTMIDYIIPEATVLATIRANEVMLNKGARDGIRPGMRMIVTRDREIIGQIQITEVDPDNSTAMIIKAMRGISPEDKCRAAFDMPEVGALKADPSTTSGTPSVTSQGTNRFSSVGKVLIPILALVLVSKIFTSSGEHVGGVAAEAGLNGYYLPVASGTPGVRVKWDKNKLSRGLNVVEYHIWRDDIAVPILTAQPSEGEAFDSGVAGSKTAQSANPQTGALGTITGTVPALDLGRPHRYYVSALYVINGVGDAVYKETERKAAGQATPLAQIPASSLSLPISGSQQNLQDVTFEWLSRRGADAYVIEASTDPNFNSIDYVSNPVYFSPAADGQRIRLEVKSALFTKYNIDMHISSDTPIWWRVGARSSSDSPGPIPADGHSNTMRYVYSEASRFYPVEMPPVQPQ